MRRFKILNYKYNLNETYVRQNMKYYKFKKKGTAVKWSVRTMGNENTNNIEREHAIMSRLASSQ